MRRLSSFAVTAVFLLVGVGPATLASAATCGRPGYPSGTEFDAEAVVNATLWTSLRERDAFVNATEGTAALEVRIPDGGRVHVVTLEEVPVRAFVGGSETSRTSVALRVVELVGTGQIAAAHNFTLLDFGGRSGANLTLLTWLDGGAVEVFWRWAYLPCSEEFPNLYYVFHARAGASGIEDDNTLVYFEATRPKRGPPVDLIVLVTAGAAASAIFLYARRAAKKAHPPESNGDDRTVK